MAFSLKPINSQGHSMAQRSHSVLLQLLVVPISRIAWVSASAEN